MTDLQPHPYALMLPGLTPAEYRALKANIERFGILYPVITDEDDLVLDGVHRVRIAAELGIEPRVSQMGQLTEQEKLQLAIGVNVCRRHLDADRRRDLVRKLCDEQGLSVREIADVTGWSKSTVGRDLTPPAAAPRGATVIRTMGSRDPIITSKPSLLSRIVADRATVGRPTREKPLLEINVFARKLTTELNGILDFRDSRVAKLDELIKHRGYLDDHVRDALAAMLGKVGDRFTSYAERLSDQK
jgi:hypothetical protein